MDNDSDIRRMVQDIVKQTIRDEEEKKECRKYFEQKKYEADVEKIAKSTTKEICESQLREAKLQFQLEIQKQVSTLTDERCRLLVPTILQRDVQDYLKSLIQGDNRLAQAYHHYLAEIQSLQKNNLEKIQTSGESVYQDFKIRVDLEIRKRIDDIVRNEMDQHFFAALLHQLSKQNEEQINQHILKITDLEQKYTFLKTSQTEIISNVKSLQSLQSTVEWLQTGFKVTSIMSVIGAIGVFALCWGKNKTFSYSSLI